MPSTEAERLSRQANWHQSGLDQILGCARQWYLEHIAGLEQGPKHKADVGTSLHAAIEFHELARMRGEELPTFEAFQAFAFEIFNELAERYDADTDVDDLRLMLEDACNNWWKTKLKGQKQSLRDMVMQWTPIALEHYVKADGIVLGARPLAGTMDAVYDRGDGDYIIVDWKTAYKFSYWGEKQLGTHRPQAAYYAALAVADPDLPITELPPVLFAIARTDHGVSRQFEGARAVQMQPDLPDIATLSQRVRTAEQIVAKGKYLPDPTYQWCKTKSTQCPFWERCMGSGELRTSIPVVEVRLNLKEPAA